MEIEKKYRVKRMPENLEQYCCKKIEQGYLCKSPVIRIRRSNEDYILTYKSKMALKDGSRIQETEARMCEEVEVPLSKEGYLHLKVKVDGRIINKRRYQIPYQERLIELDVFEGFLEGLVFAEVEFENEAQAKEFVPPEWFGEEVTFDYRFSNNYLAHDYEGTYSEDPF